MLRLFNILGVEVALGKPLQASEASSPAADKPAW
jgi:hypothetical protein